jgi:hypothetical protein
MPGVQPAGRLAAVARLLASPRYEVFPAGGVEHAVAEWVPPGMTVPGGYSPDRLLERAAGTLAAPASGVAGLHLFTFNQIRQTEQWRRTLLARARG